MLNRGINNQIIFLALLPALLVAMVLTGYFTWSQLDYISASLQRHGNTISSQIAPAAEFAVFSGNTTELRRVLRYTLEQDKDVINIEISNADNEVLLSLADRPPERRYPRLLYALFTDNKVLTFRKPITTQELLVNDFDEDMLLTTEHESTNNVIGYVDLSLTTLHSSEQKIETLLKGTLLTLAILLISAVLAMRYSRKISNPIVIITDAVRKFAEGNFQTRISQGGPGELATLESCVNKMADELSAAQNDMESRINEFTQELQQTLEELEIRNAELDITRSNAMQASRSKSEFLANMSHEIRTPLSGILGFTELLDSTSLNIQQKDYTVTIQKSARNLMSIIDDILDLSKIESGKLDIMLMKFSLLDVVEDVINLLAPIAYESNIELIYSIDAEVSRQIQSDPVRIRQVLLNLIGNAVKFTEYGYVSLHISRGELEESTHSVRFTVTDTGIGMNLAKKQKLFNAFTQGDTSITRKFGGTGLGLVISRKLVLLMRGEISFDSTENEGSRFWFDVPVDIEATSRDPVSSALAGKRIALIEEHDECRRTLLCMLQQWGSEVEPLTRREWNSENHPLEQRRFDAIVIGISRGQLAEAEDYRDLRQRIIKKQIPTLAIISTRSYIELDAFRSIGFDRIVFRSSRQETIRSELTGLITGKHSAGDRVLPMQESTAEIALPRLRILVVDDNQINLRLAEILLKKRGMHVSTAYSGDECIDRIKQTDFDLVLMDLHMPGLNGYESASRIRALEEDGKHAIIIALTANAMPQEIERIDKFGMDDVLIKPISDQMIVSIINRYFYCDYKPPVTPRNEPVASADNTVFSFEGARELTNGNTDLAIELVSMLRNELPQHRQAIITAHSRDDTDSLKAHAHKLNGASRCCGTPALKQAADALENALESDPPESIGSLVEDLVAAIDELLAYDLQHAAASAER